MHVASIPIKPEHCVADTLDKEVPRKDLPNICKAASNGSQDPITSLPFFHVVSKAFSAVSEIFPLFTSPSVAKKENK